MNVNFHASLNIGGGHHGPRPEGANFDALLNGPGRHGRREREDGCGCGEMIDFKEAAGYCGLDKDEFKELCKQAGITDEKQIEELFDQISKGDGTISKADFKEAFGDTKVSAEDFKKKLEELSKGDECGCKDKEIDFDKAAGNDGLSEDEFAALAKKAGIEDEEQIKKVFEQIAGSADGKISKEEFEEAFGGTKLSPEDFKKKFEELAKGDECGCDKPENPEHGGKPEKPEQGCGPEKPEQGCGPDESQGPRSRDHWSVEQKNGEATIKLGDDYTIKVKEDGSSIKVKNNCTGQETEISGDPHFRGKNNFDFKNGLTLCLDNGAKLTIGTTPAGNGTTLATSLTITQGNKAIEVSGIAQGGTDGALRVEQSFDGRRVDRQTPDGFATLEETPGGWFLDGKFVTQQIVNQAEAAYHG